MVSLANSESVVYQHISDLTIFDIIVHSGWFGILILLLTITCTMITIIHFVEELSTGYSSNPIVRWCGRTLGGIEWVCISLVLLVFSLLLFVFSSNSLFMETVAKNVSQKYSFDNVKVKEIEYGNVDIAHSIVYDYDKKNSFEVKIWVDPVTNEPTIQNNDLVSDKYLSGFVK